ncbi:uncharacterized protein LOC101860765 isoform X2 [Aplysia californica]|uniref:Uncharacterized protein LOC101860765 isoform X2 n=1 Tax=Aplysia californica TaxID=6500 RepID=A0ABM0K0Z6_APLCA|nr:uncharacterized protein LOC101860765 isoform X2 [Aplysia californica]
MKSLAFLASFIAVGLYGVKSQVDGIRQAGYYDRPIIGQEDPIGPGFWKNKFTTVVSRRDISGLDQTSLFDAISELLVKARQGIDVGELANETEQIKQMAAVIRGETGVAVNSEKVHQIINDVASTFNRATSISALFDDPMDFQVSKMDSALLLLNGLAAKAQEMQKSGEPLQDVMAAIEMTCSAIEEVSEDIDGHWEGGAGYSQESGFHVGVKYRWGRR